MRTFGSCFISYGQLDVGVAGRLNTFLRNSGVRTWVWYEHRTPGEWRPQIQKALDDHDHILLVVSQGSLERLGVQDENRLALADDVRPYKGRLIPVLIDDLDAIASRARTPEGRELLNLVRQVMCVRLVGGKFTRESREMLLSILERQVKVLVIGSVSVEEVHLNEAKRPFIEKAARCIGKHLALHRSKPICMTTVGGGIDFLVCEGFENSALREEAGSRLWLYPPAQERIFYRGFGRRVELDGLPLFEGKDQIIPQDRRGRILVSKMAADADAVIALRGGRGIEYAFVVCLGGKKRFVCVPGLGGMSEKLYRIYGTLPIVVSPDLCLEPPDWNQTVQAEPMAETLVAP